MKPRSLLRDNKGSVAIMFALTLTLLLLAAGVAIDYAVAVSRKRTLDIAMDTALLAGTNAASQAQRKGDANWSTIGQQVADQVMRINLTNDTLASLTSFQAEFVKQGSKTIGTTTYNAASRNYLMGMFGNERIGLSNSARAAVDPGNYVDIHFLIDNSSSMGIGADAAMQSLLYRSIGTNPKGQKSASNCELACHFNDGGYVITPQDASAYGAKLRIDVVREAVIDSITALRAKGLPADRIRVSLHTFSHGIKTITDPTSDLSQVATLAQAITLDNTNTGGGTYLWKSIGQLSAKLGKGGTGNSNTDRLSFVVIFSDGVENNGQMTYVSGVRYQFKAISDSSEWKKTTGETHAIGTTIQPLDATRCDNLKSTSTLSSGNHLVFSIQVKYFIGPEIRKDSPWQTGVIDKIENSVEASLKQCASKPEYHVKAADSQGIKPAFKKVMDEISGAQVVYLAH